MLDLLFVILIVTAAALYLGWVLLRWSRAKSGCDCGGGSRTPRTRKQRLTIGKT